MESDDRRPQIVLAEDHREVLIAFERLLESSCDMIATVHNGAAAIDAVTRLKPDIAVIDLMMPDMDGLEVCRRLKEVAPETGIVIVTAFDDTQVETRALQLGAAAFVPKQSVAVALERTILRVFAERQLKSSMLGAPSKTP